MLRELEQRLVPVVDAAVPIAVIVQRGPFEVGSSWPNNRRVIVIDARRLDVHETPPPTVDDSAFAVETATWPTDGVTDAFTLPPASVGEVLEVEAPEGFLATPGDDYYVDDDTIRFYQVPTGPGQVVARIRGADAAGYARRSPCTLTLDVTAYSESIDTADPLMEEAMQIVLVELRRAPYFVADDGGLGTRVRLSRLRGHLRSIERRAIDTDDVVACTASIHVIGELDFIIPTGDPEPVGVISEIEGEVQVEVPGDQPPPPLSIHIEAPPSEPGGG